MALDRIINKVIDKNSTLLDLTNDTVNENRLLEDITAHNSEGESITGRYDASDAEAWARGTRYGIPVSNTDETYHNNALFYAEESENYAAISGSCMNIAGNYAETAENQAIRSGSFANIAGLSAEIAEQSEIRSGSFANIAGLSAQSATDNALKSEGFAVGKQNGTDVGSTSPYCHNNAEYFKNLAEEAAAQAGALDMTGATATTDGTHGLIKQPHAGDQDKFFRGDGTWADLPEFQGVSGSIASIGGIVPPAQAGDEDKVFNGRGEWGKRLQIDIVMQNGEYGYINSNNQFVAFKSQADIDAAVSAAMVGTATAADVKSGKTFTNSTTSGVTGTFAAQEKSTTSSRSAQTITPDSGKYLSKVTIAKYPDASGTYTPTANSSASDMGTTNNYRYVDTRTVYNLGKSNAAIGQDNNGGDKGFTRSGGITGLTNGRYYALAIFWISRSYGSGQKATVSSGATTILNLYAGYASYATSGTYVLVQLLLVKTTSTTIKFSFPNPSGDTWLGCAYARLTTS